MRASLGVSGRPIRAWSMAAGALLLAVLLAAGCQSGGARPSGAAVPQAKTQPAVQPAGLYLDFEDVAVPVGLTLEKARSYVYQTAGLKAGVLSFSTNRPLSALAAFFEENMPRDNWTLVSTFRFGKIIQYYQKNAKICLILIESRTDIDLNRVEVWVSPKKPG
jgi:hypothetical protein